MKNNLLVSVVCIATLVALVLPGYAQYDTLDVTKHLNITPPPSWQLESGTPPDEIVCNPSLQLLTRPNGSPACIRTESIPRLVERGWTTVDNTNSVQVAIHPTSTNNTNVDIPQNTSATPFSTDIASSNQFTLKFYSHVSQDNEDNIFFSPMSISTAFAMMYEGAIGNTARQIQNVFEFSENDELRRGGFQNMLESSNASSEYNLTIANALWLAKAFHPHEQYVSVVETYYGSKIREVDFASDSATATDTINDWISEKTEKKIKKLFDPELHPDTRMVITNAVYFNALWESQFETTYPDEFVISASKNETVEVEMMAVDGYFKYYEDELLQLVELPYLGDRISMLVLLPKNVGGILDLENSLTMENFSQWKKGSNMEIAVKIPVFSLDTEYDLVNTLPKMGINDAFNTHADFSGIHDAGELLYIERSVHKAFVDVTEKGTEAGAATGISASFDSAPGAMVYANHPFVFIIHDMETENILFIGRLANPE